MTTHVDSGHGGQLPNDDHNDYEEDDMDEGVIIIIDNSGHR